MTESTNINNLSVSENALRRINFLLQKKPAGSKFRIEVQGGGCSGLQYKFEFTQQMNEDDISFYEDLVIVDQNSLSLIHDSILDYVENLGGAYFEMRNPNAKASCGCGNSFAI